MPLLKYHTIGRNSHRHGRVCLRFDTDPAGRILYLNVLTARGLNGGYNGGTAGVPNIQAMYTKIRCQLLPHKNPALVTQSLLKPRSAEGNYKKQTVTYLTTGVIEFNEDFAFDLMEIAQFKNEFRLYIAALSSDKKDVDHDGDQIISGLMSFSVAELANLANLKGAGESTRSHWYWFCAASVGLHKNDAVEQMVVAADSMQVKPDVVISGRLPEYPNSHINGVYTWELDVYGGLPTYRHRSELLWIYFNQEKQSWCIGDAIGTNSPLAFVNDSSSSPDRVTGWWHVYNRGKQLNTSLPEVPLEKATYVTDHQVYSGRVATSGLARPTTERGRQIVRLIASQEIFSENLRLLRRYKPELEKVITDTDYPGGIQALLAPLLPLESTMEFFNDQLVRGQVNDPLFRAPMGGLLIHIAQSMRPVFIKFCENLKFKIEVVSKIDGSDSSFLNSNAVAQLFEEPFLQLQRYPLFVDSIVQASELSLTAVDTQDMRTLRDTRNYMQETYSMALHALSAGAYQNVFHLNNSIGAANSSVPPDAPAWFHGVLSQVEAAQFLAGHPDGTFLVRQRPDMPDNFALALVFEGQTTHHMFSQSLDGMYSINNVNLGVTELKDAVDRLRRPIDGWLCPLSKCAVRPGATAEAEAAEEAIISVMIRSSLQEGQQSPTTISAPKIAKIEAHPTSPPNDDMREEHNSIEAISQSDEILNNAGDESETHKEVTVTIHEQDVSAANSEAPILDLVRDTASTESTFDPVHASTPTSKKKLDFQHSNVEEADDALNATVHKKCNFKLVSDGAGLGFAFIGPKLLDETGKGCFVTKVYEDGPASRAGISRGMKIISVNDIDVRHLTKTELLGILKEKTVLWDFQMQMDPRGFSYYDGGELQVSFEASIGGNANSSFKSMIESPIGVAEGSPTRSAYTSRLSGSDGQWYPDSHALVAVQCGDDGLWYAADDGRIDPQDGVWYSTKAWDKYDAVVGDDHSQNDTIQSYVLPVGEKIVIDLAVLNGESGIKIVGPSSDNRNTDTGCFVAEVVADVQVATGMKLKPGMRIFMINNKSTSGMSEDECAATIAGSDLQPQIRPPWDTDFDRVAANEFLSTSHSNGVFVVRPPEGLENSAKIKKAEILKVLSTVQNNRVMHLPIDRDDKGLVGLARGQSARFTTIDRLVRAAQIAGATALPHPLRISAKLAADEFPSGVRKCRLLLRFDPEGYAHYDGGALRALLGGSGADTSDLSVNYSVVLDGKWRTNERIGSELYNALSSLSNVEFRDTSDGPYSTSRAAYSILRQGGLWPGAGVSRLLLVVDGNDTETTFGVVDTYGNVEYVTTADGLGGSLSSERKMAASRSIRDKYGDQIDVIFVTGALHSALEASGSPVIPDGAELPRHIQFKAGEHFDMDFLTNVFAGTKMIVVQHVRIGSSVFRAGWTARYGSPVIHVNTNEVAIVDPTSMVRTEIKAISDDIDTTAITIRQLLGEDIKQILDVEQARALGPPAYNAFNDGDSSIVGTTVVPDAASTPVPKSTNNEDETGGLYAAAKAAKSRRVVNAIESPESSGNPSSETGSIISLTIERGRKGFGLVLGNEGAGTFIVMAKPNSTAATAMNTASLDASEGLRLKTIDNIDVLNSSKKAALAAMKSSKGSTVFELFKEPTGFPAVLAAWEAKKAEVSRTSAPTQAEQQPEIPLQQTSETGPTREFDAEIEVSMEKNTAGFGMTLRNEGSGTFIVKTKPGGVAEAALLQANLSTDDGLRFKSINGVDVYDAPKKIAMKEVKNCDSKLICVLVKDPVGYPAVLAAWEERHGQDVEESRVTGNTHNVLSPNEPVPGPEENIGITVTITKTDAGFGMTLGNEGYGTFIVQTKPGGPAESTLQQAGLAVVEGLRFHSINAVDVYDATKKSTMREIKASGPSLTCVLVKDPDGYPAVLDAWKAKSSRGQAPELVEAQTEMASVPDMKIEETPTIQKYDGMGRLALIRECRSRNIDYGEIKDKEGLLDLLVAADSKSQESAVMQSTDSDLGFRTADVTVEKGPKGFGWVTGSAGNGTFISRIKSAGPAAQAFAAVGLSASDGLRFQQINGQNVYSKEKKVVASILKQAESAQCRFSIEPEGHLAVLAAREAEKAEKQKPISEDTIAESVISPEQGSAATDLGVDVEQHTAGASPSKYQEMGRLALMKECRSRGLDYSSVSKDKDALIALLVNDDA